MANPVLAELEASVTNITTVVDSALALINGIAARVQGQHYNYGRGAYCFRRVHASRGGTEIGFERWRFYLDLATTRCRRGGSTSAAA